MMPTRSASSSGSVERGVEEGEDVGGVELAEAAPDRPAVRLAVAGRAARVALHHRVPGRDVGLRLVEQRPAVLRERAAVDGQQHRVRPGPGRHGDPAVHRVAVRGVAVRSRIRCTRPVSPSRRPNAVSSRRRPGVIAISSPADRSCATTATTTPPPAANAAHGERPVDQRLRRAAVQRHAQQLHRAPRAATPTSTAPSTTTVAGRLVAAVVQRRVEQRLQRPPSASTRHGTACRATKSTPSGPEVGHGGDVRAPAVRVVGRQRAVAPRAGDPPQPRAVGRDRVDVADQVDGRRAGAAPRRRRARRRRDAR